MQKFDGRDPESGDVCGIYFFEDGELLRSLRETELARTIPSAYEAVEVRREAYDVLCPLRPERGPFAPWPGATSRRGLQRRHGRLLSCVLASSSTPTSRT